VHETYFHSLLCNLPVGVLQAPHRSPPLAEQRCGDGQTAAPLPAWISHLIADVGAACRAADWTSQAGIIVQTISSAMRRKYM
jgi:hypothetical protein